jgi:hypothetical protein
MTVSDRDKHLLAPLGTLRVKDRDDVKLFFSLCLQRDLHILAPCPMSIYMFDHFWSKTRKHMPLAPVRCCLSIVCVRTFLFFFVSVFEQVLDNLMSFDL